MDNHSLIKVTNMFNMIGPTIINGKGRLVEAMREFSLFNTLRKKGAGYLKESLSHGNMPLAPSWWSFGPYTILISSRTSMG